MHKERKDEENGDCQLDYQQISHRGTLKYLLDNLTSENHTPIRYQMALWDLAKNPYITPAQRHQAAERVFNRSAVARYPHTIEIGLSAFIKQHWNGDMYGHYTPSLQKAQSWGRDISVRAWDAGMNDQARQQAETSALDRRLRRRNCLDRVEQGLVGSFLSDMFGTDEHAWEAFVRMLDGFEGSFRELGTTSELHVEK